MKILMIAINDPAGTAIEFTKAINKYTDHTCRLITKEIHYNFMFEKDLHLPWLDADGWAEIEQLFRTSDIFHFHTITDENIELGSFRPAEYIRGKIIVHHHHGHPDFRNNPEKYRKKYREKGRNNLLVSTPDLLKLMPEATWQPNLVPVEEPLYMPMEDKPEQPIVISHSPTRKDLKNTAEFILSVEEIRRKTAVPVELRLIENTPHKECLRLKRESHIHFDHLQGYFGVSSLEGLSQGLCVIAGLDTFNREHIQRFTRAEDLPWIHADTTTLGDVMTMLVSDRDRRKDAGLRARAFMEECWHDRQVAAQLSRFYDRCC